MSVLVRVVPVSFSVWCEECRRWIGVPAEKSTANRAANKHRREHKRSEPTGVVVHEAKLEVPA